MAGRYGGRPSPPPARPGRRTRPRATSACPPRHPVRIPPASPNRRSSNRGPIYKGTSGSSSGRRSRRPRPRPPRPNAPAHDAFTRLLHRLEPDPASVAIGAITPSHPQICPCRTARRLRFDPAIRDRPRDQPRPIGEGVEHLLAPRLRSTAAASPRSPGRARRAGGSRPCGRGGCRSRRVGKPTPAPRRPCSSRPSRRPASGFRLRRPPV